MSIALMFCTKLTPMSQNGQKLSLIFETKKLLKFVNSQNKKCRNTYILLKINLIDKQNFTNKKQTFERNKKQAERLVFWWVEMDSNHRRLCRQIYSLLPLATRASTHVGSRLPYWSWWADLNRQPADYKSAALPIEPHQHKKLSVA